MRPFNVEEISGFYLIKSDYFPRAIYTAEGFGQFLGRVFSTEVIEAAMKTCSMVTVTSKIEPYRGHAVTEEDTR